MPYLFALIVPVLSYLARSAVAFITSFFIKRVFFRVVGLIALFSSFYFVFVPFIGNVARSFIKDLAYVQDFINTMSIFLPSNFNFCISAICSMYILIFIFSWKTYIVRIFGG